MTDNLYEKVRFDIATFTERTFGIQLTDLQKEIFNQLDSWKVCDLCQIQSHRRSKRSWEDVYKELFHKDPPKLERSDNWRTPITIIIDDLTTTDIRWKK